MKNNNQPIKFIEVGKFYIVHDGSKDGHPCLIVWKDDDANLYLAIKFGTTQNDKNDPIMHPLSKNVSIHYIYKRPLLIKRKDIGREWVFDYEIDNDDKPAINDIIYKNPVYSKNINRKNRRYFSLVIKNKKIKTVI